MVTMLSMTLVAVGAAVAAWLRPTPRDSGPPVPPTPTFSEQQMADAKANVCGAYALSKNEVAVNTHRPAPPEDDYNSSLAVSALARLATYAAGDYLLNRLSAEPATPPELAVSVRSLANTYKEIGIHALNNEPNATLDTLRHTIDADITNIDEMCK